METHTHTHTHTHRLEVAAECKLLMRKASNRLAKGDPRHANMTGAHSSESKCSEPCSKYPHRLGHTSLWRTAEPPHCRSAGHWNSTPPECCRMWPVCPVGAHAARSCKYTRTHNHVTRHHAGTTPHQLGQAPRKPHDVKRSAIQVGSGQTGKRQWKNTDQRWHQNENCQCARLQTALETVTRGDAKATGAHSSERECSEPCSKCPRRQRHKRLWRTGCYLHCRFASRWNSGPDQCCRI